LSPILLPHVVPPGPVSFKFMTPFYLKNKSQNPFRLSMR
jgi:hypothetical protein